MSSAAVANYAENTNTALSILEENMFALKPRKFLVEQCPDLVHMEQLVNGSEDGLGVVGIDSQVFSL